jgi:pseudaminic acid biosynthesis-associated methylase
MATQLREQPGRLGVYSTPQETFWAGDFGTAYIERNQSDALLAANISFFADVLESTGRIESCVELGANVGMNLRALKMLIPGLQARGVEINPDAATQLRILIGHENVTEGSLLDCALEPADLAFTKGVLIHLNPEVLPVAYDRLYAASKRFILVAEYYNPTPVSVLYRGHDDRLFKRDFAGEMREQFPDLVLIDYGFLYRHDPLFPQDDITWFLMEKRSS